MAQAMYVSRGINFGVDLGLVTAKKYELRGSTNIFVRLLIYPGRLT